MIENLQMAQGFAQRVAVVNDDGSVSIDDGQEVEYSLDASGFTNPNLHRRIQDSSELSSQLGVFGQDSYRILQRSEDVGGLGDSEVP